jgi:asparagine synthase (glutamine-hydrolysing)
MLESLEAHGPDDSSLLADDFPPNTDGSFRNAMRGVALGHRLLKITAEDELETQPLPVRPLQRSSIDQFPPVTGWLVADARIDNRAELAATLGIAADEAESMPDSAFILRAWQRWSQDCVEHLLGSFAFAVWDASAERFFLARDHAGDRPLYYRKTADFFAFATTARAVRSCPGVSSELDERQLARDLIGLPPEPPLTRFREVQAIAPGHCLIVGREGATHRRYWQIDRLRPVRFARDEDYVAAFLEIFDEAVRCRLRTTGGIATQLSAGLDSGSVAATAARLLAAGEGVRCSSGATLTAYTAVPCPEFSKIVSPGLIADEGPYAAAVAALYPNMHQILVDTTGSDMLRELARIYPLLDLPHAAALNAVWGNTICDRAKSAGVKVMLTGALGNFAFSYSGGDLLRESFRRGRWMATLVQAWRLRRAGLSSGRNAASLTVFDGLPWALRRRIDPLIRSIDVDWSAIRPERAREFDSVDQFRRYLFTRRTALPHLMETQFQQNQYGDYNAAIGAAWGIEARDPTADKRVFELCAAIPQEQFVVGGVGRSLVRRAMRGRLPDATLDRKEKGTQAADWYESLSRIRGELSVELTLQTQSPGARRLIDLDRLRGILDHWPKTAQEAARKDSIYDSAISRGIAVGYFIRRIEEESRG